MFILSRKQLIPEKAHLLQTLSEKKPEALNCFKFYPIQMELSSRTNFILATSFLQGQFSWLVYGNSTRNSHEVFLKLLNGQQLCADNANFNDFIVLKFMLEGREQYGRSVQRVKREEGVEGFESGTEPGRKLGNVC